MSHPDCLREETKWKNEYQQRVSDTKELVNQIGMMNVLAISGGRVHSIVNDQGETVEVQLPVGHG
jgi:hypothetical protein